MLKKLDKVLLFFAPLLGIFCSRWTKYQKLKRLFNKGNAKINKEFNVVKIVKSLRNMKVFFKNSLITEKIKYEIKHS